MDFDILLHDSYLQGKLLHEIFACMFCVPYLWYLYVLFSKKTYLYINQKIYFIAPITFFLLGVALATGIFLCAMRSFIFDFRIILMIFVFIAFFGGEIYRIISLKKAKTSKEGMQKYVRFCKILYSCFLVSYVLLIFFLKVF